MVKNSGIDRTLLMVSLLLIAIGFLMISAPHRSSPVKSLVTVFIFSRSNCSGWFWG
jgi:type III secretory pathway component EscR